MFMRRSMLIGKVLFLENRLEIEGKYIEDI